VGAVLGGLWVLLWREAPWPTKLAGAVWPVILGLAARRGFLTFRGPWTPWVRWDLWVLLFLAVGWMITRAVVATAWAVLRGRASPGIVGVPVRLTPGVPQLLFLWAITVTPGTIAILVEEHWAYVHCLHRPSGPEVPGLALLERILGRLWP